MRALLALPPGLILIFAILIWNGNNPPADHFKFLKGHETMYSGVSIVPEGAYGFREYSWQQDYKSAEKNVGNELASKGYNLHSHDDGYANWIGPTSEEVWLLGESRTKSGASCSGTQTVPGWITLTIGKTVPDTLTTEAKALLTGVGCRGGTFRE